MVAAASLLSPKSHSPPLAVHSKPQNSVSLGVTESAGESSGTTSEEAGSGSSEVKGVCTGMRCSVHEHPEAVTTKMCARSARV